MCLRSQWGWSFWEGTSPAQPSLVWSQPQPGGRGGGLWNRAGPRCLWEGLRPSSPQGHLPGEDSTSIHTSAWPQKRHQRKGHTSLTGDHLMPEDLWGWKGEGRGVLSSWDSPPGKKCALTRNCWDHCRGTERNLPKWPLRTPHNKKYPLASHVGGKFILVSSWEMLLRNQCHMNGRTKSSWWSEQKHYRSGSIVNKQTLPLHVLLSVTF